MTGYPCCCQEADDCTECCDPPLDLSDVLEVDLDSGGWTDDISDQCDAVNGTFQLSNSGSCAVPNYTDHSGDCACWRYSNESWDSISVPHAFIDECQIECDTSGDTLVINIQLTILATPTLNENSSCSWTVTIFMYLTCPGPNPPNPSCREMQSTAIYESGEVSAEAACDSSGITLTKTSEEHNYYESGSEISGSNLCAGTLPTTITLTRV